MKHVKMKIKEQFITLIERGIKKHEYRINDPKNQDIKIGDIIILVSNNNSKKYLKVIVASIEHYSSWEEALKDRWQEDFKGLYSTQEEVIKETQRYYSKEEVEKYGINVYKINTFKSKFNKSRFLLDTNIIIERESSNNVSPDVSLVYKAIEKIGGTKFIHEKTIEEIKKYKDEKVKENMLIKLKAYQTLISKSDTTSDFEDICKRYSLDENSKNDNELLKQVFNGNVDFLITNDKGIIKKAEDLYIADKVLTQFSFLTRFEEENPRLIEYDVLSINLVDIGTLDINDSFFNSLREDYEGIKFNDWLKKKSNAKAYVYKNDTEIKGFLYLKPEGEDEDYSMFKEPFKPAKRLKIGTFKIEQSGLRLGERFLKIIFDNALKIKAGEIYVTLFEDKREGVKRLKEMLEEWGFCKKTYKNNGEAVLVKTLQNYDDSKDPKFNYPLQKEKKKHFFLPILSQYHTRLFPDLFLKNEMIKLNKETENPCGYAIEKIYITNAKFISASPGDIVCIYRMGDFYRSYTSVVTGIGIVQEIKYPTSLDDYLNHCKNKSVFSETELRNFYCNREYRTIIKMLFLERFDHKVILKKLYENSIIELGKGPRVFDFISDDNYRTILELGEGNL